MDHESINPVFALFDCLGAILYELLISGLMDEVFQPDACEAFAVVLEDREKKHLYQGNRGRKAKF